MFEIFKYRFKIMISDRVNIFWTLIFPILLVSLFSLAFSNISEENLYKDNKVGVVTNNKNSVTIKMLKEAKDQKLPLFKLEKLSNKKLALTKLNDKKIGAIVEVDNKDNFSLTLKDQGLNQLILEEFLTKYKQNKKMMGDIIQKNPNFMKSDLVSKLDYGKQYVKDMNVSEKTNNEIIVSFYSAIAMACLFGAFLSATAPNTLQPNISYQGARVYVSPYSKWRLVVADLVSSFSITLTSLIILILYMNYVLKIEFSNQINYIILIVVLGALLSTCLGYFISLLLKKNNTVKVSFIIAFTMIGSFLSGMMRPEIKYNIEQVLPFIKYINPVALITDSFNILYYYNDFTMIQGNLLCLIIMSLILFIGSLIILRRDRYDSL